MITTVPSSSQIPTKLSLSQVLEFVFSPFLPKVDNNISEVKVRKAERERERVSGQKREKRKKNEVRDRKRKITFKSFLFSFFQMTQ